MLRLDDDDDEAERKALDGAADKAAGKIEAALNKQLTALAKADPAIVAGGANSFEHGEEFRRLLLEVLVDGADAGTGNATRTLARIGASFDFTMVHERAQSWAQQYSYDLVRGINNTTRQVLQSAVGDWIGQGQPLSTLIAQVQPAFGPNRAKAIAYTETTRAFAEGSVLSFEASGVVDSVEWAANRDERVCPICGGYHGKQFPLRGGIRPPAHIGCRCWVLPVVPDEYGRALEKPKPTPKPVVDDLAERRRRAEEIAAAARAEAERLAIEEQQRQAVAPALPAVPQPKENAIERVEAKLDTAIARIAQRYKTTVEEVEATVAKAAADLTDPSKPVSLRAPSGAIDAILDSGRFKSQFETGTSGAVLDKDLRARAEERGLGVAYDSAPDQRPIYGYIPNPQFDRYVKQYGDLVVEFKPEVRNRTTVLMGDSLTPMNSGEGVPSPLNNLRKASWDGNITSLYETAKGHEEWVMTGMEYVEVQIHGQAKVGDIARIRDTESKLTVTQLQRLRGLGIDVVDKDGLGRN